MDVRLFGTIRTKSPLSHISEAISTNSYLVQDPIIQEDGSIEDVFCYSGNAFRGQMRDCCGKYMLRYLDRKLNLDSFHLVFSGGKIGKDQIVDLDVAKIIRLNVPIIGIFGGGIGNQIIAGKMKFQNIYPICREAIPVLPFELHQRAKERTYIDMTDEKSFSRMDDAKNDLYSKFIKQNEEVEENEENEEVGENEEVEENEENEEVGEKVKKKVKKKAVSDQMRMTSELLNAGIDLYCAIDLIDVNEIEIGTLISGFHILADNPYIGGQSNKGHGHIDLNFSCILSTTTNRVIVNDFLSIKDGELNLSKEADDFESAYVSTLAKIKSGQFNDDDSIADKSKIEKIVAEFWS